VSNLEDLIIQILCNYTGVSSSNSNFDKDSRFGEDFGLDGDDAKDVLNEISNKLNLDISRLEFEKYFHNESDCSLFKSIFQSFFSKPQKKDLTVAEFISICSL